MTSSSHLIRMSTAVFCTAILVGICAWGFLVAGATSFYDTEKPTIRGFGVPLAFLDLFVTLGFFTMLFIIARNWRRKPEARRMLYAGVACLAVALGLGFFYLRIS